LPAAHDATPVSAVNDEHEDVLAAPSGGLDDR
jgi:hypothetical protein